MLGRLESLTVNQDGSQNITVTVQADFREAFDELHEKDVDIEIKKYSKRRSIDSNNLAWALIDKIAAHENKKKSEVYREAIKDIGGVSDTVCAKNIAVEKLVTGWTHKGLGWQAECEPSKLPGCTNVTLYYGSSVFSTQQMAALIDSLIQDCNALGIPTMSEEEVQRSLAYWQKKVEKREQVDTSE